MNQVEVAFVNGEWVPRAEAVIPAEDRGFLFGDAIYEVLRVYGSRLFAAAEHLERLRMSAAALEIELPYRDAELLELMNELVERNGHAEASVYLQISRGAAPRNHIFPDHARPTVFMVSQPAAAPAPEELERGVSAITVPDNRWGLCGVKTTGLLPNVLAKEEARRQGVYEAIFVRDGLVTEGSATNVLMAASGVIYTYPLANILPGVTRRLILEDAAALEIPVREEAWPLARLRRAEEIVLLGTITEVVPVTELDGRPVGDGSPGPICGRLRERFDVRVAATRRGEA